MSVYVIVALEINEEISFFFVLTLSCGGCGGGSSMKIVTTQT